MVDDGNPWPGDGEIGARAIRARRWGDTPLGPIEDWPQCLKAAVDLVLSLAVPAAVLWGPQLVTIPNAAFARAAEGGGLVRAGALAAKEWVGRWPAGQDPYARVREGDTVVLEASGLRPALAFSPLRDGAGLVAGVLVTERGGRSPATAGLAELQHQSRNALAWVRSIVRRSAVTSEDLEDFLMHLDGRIDAFSRVRSAAAVAPEEISLAGIIASELLVVAAQENGHLSIEGPDIGLKIRAAESLTLGFHELATNAMKFGALASPEGRIAITWRIETRADRKIVVLDWKEMGVPGPLTLTRRGFGLEVIERSLSYELGARSRFALEPDGARCVIEADLDRLGTA